MKAEDLDKLLEKYGRGACNEEEIKLIEKFLDHISNTELNVFETQSPEFIEKELKTRIDESIRQNELNTEKPSGIEWIFWQKVVAASLLLLLAGIGWFYVRDKNTQNPTSFIIWHIPDGKRQTVRLADGSAVYLNAGSVFKVPHSFQGATREVYLEGEAYFEVAKNPEKPFIIHSGKTQTQVLGTSFTINAYPDNNKIEVAVLTGRVQVSANQSKVLLTANQLAVYDKKNEKFSQDILYNTEVYKSWIDGKLVFQKKSLTEIVAVLNRYYDVDIILDDKQLGSCELNMSFDNDSLETVLKIICNYTNARYKRSNKQISIRGKGC